MGANGATADRQRGEDGNENKLVYKGETWTVQAPPAVVDSDGGWELVEVWVTKEERTSG